jgi:glycerate dehydrogenase
MKIVILDGYTENPGDLSWDPIGRYGELTVYDRTPADEITSRIRDAEAIFTNKTLITREILQSAPNLRYIGVLATGYNVVDIEAAKEKGVIVTNIPAYSTPSVAQHTIALLLELCHRIGHHSDTVAEGRWQNSTEWCYWDYPLIELEGKTLGLLGFGRIASAVADIARAMGMRIIAHRRNPDPREGVRYVSSDTLFAEADVLSLHCPLTEDTKGIIRKDNICKMKDGAMIINTARGSLIEDGDLADALKSGKIAGAALDVLTQEPPRDGNPLIGIKNCIITPHMAWAPKESRARLMDIAAANLAAFIAGSPVHVVNE